MTGLSRFDLYPRDWLSGTRELSLRARGMYIDLLARMYDLGRPLDYDEKELCRFLSLHDRRQLRPVLEELFDKNKIIATGDGKLTNERFEKELEAANLHIENSKRGGQAKAQNRKTNPKSPSQRVVNALSTRIGGGGFEEKQPLNPCLPSPSPSKRKDTSKEGGKAAYWNHVKAMVEKSGRPENQVRTTMGRLLNLHDGNFAGAAVVLETCLGKNDPFTYMTEIIKRLKGGPPKQGGAGFNGPYQRSQEDADYIAGLDPCHLDQDEKAYLEDLRREQADG